MNKFNSTHIIIGQIKELLHSFNLPQLKVITKGITVFPNVSYIFSGGVYKYVGKTPLRITRDFKTLPSYFIFEHSYGYGQAILNRTKTMNISGVEYDAYTHEYLGDYLRFHRDFMNIDLMSMYNCFSNNINTSINISTDEFSFDASDKGHKIFMLPVRFGKVYTIGIDCDTTIEIVSGFHSTSEISKLGKDESAIPFYKSTYQQKLGTQFKKPFIYDKLAKITPSLNQGRLEKNLVLFLKVPISNTSSITVLEGDFRAGTNTYFDEMGAEKICNLPIFYDNEPTPGIFEEMTYYSYITRPGLLKFNSGTSLPFSVRLVEYLFGNVVDSSDRISQNIERIQTALLKVKQDAGVRLTGVVKYGEWNEKLRQLIYHNYVKLGLIHKTFDSIGFYDKDIEEVIFYDSEVGE